jgi:hypothetical protein
MCAGARDRAPEAPSDGRLGCSPERSNPNAALALSDGLEFQVVEIIFKGVLEFDLRALGLQSITRFYIAVLDSGGAPLVLPGRAF